MLASLMTSTTDKQQLFKEALGNYPAELTIVTTADNENVFVRLTVNSFASVSLILWSTAHRVSSLDTFKKLVNLRFIF